MRNNALAITVLTICSWCTAATAQPMGRPAADTTADTTPSLANRQTASADFDAATEAKASYGVDDVPNVRLADKRRHVSDPNGLLGTAARDTIDALLTTLEDSTGHQVAVVMLPSIGNADLFDFSQELFETWGIGRKDEDDGMLIVYIADQRAIRFHTGYGLEGDMTDARSKRIQTTEMVPHFKNGDTDGGMTVGVRAVCETLCQGASGADGQGDSNDGPSAWWLLLIAPMAGGIWLAGTITTKRRRCPHCGQCGHVRKQKSDTFEKDYKVYWRATYACSLCGHEYVKTGLQYDKRDWNSTPNGGGTNSSIPNMGASYGGGTSGGGGASSRW